MLHLLSAAQLTRDHMQQLLALAAECAAGKQNQSMAGRICATVFHEPSTRTRMSFEAAALRLGMGVISESNPAASSASKGETLEDTVQVISQYADVLVLRQGATDGAARAATTSTCPLVNAGSGAGEHPTQSLIDLYTIAQQHNVFAPGLKVALVGDLKYGRTVHSLRQMLTTIGGAHVRLVSPAALAMPSQYTEPDDTVHTELTPDVLAWADVVYMTRVQKERFQTTEAYNAVAGSCVLTPALAAHLRPTAQVLHPLPRIDEIPTAIDALPQAWYFKQAANGVPVRMAILQWVLAQ